ncbi:MULTISPECIES: hypothetical protein [unclassified Crossiella]|uniref:hypothetical protein n=1 Tax=unclassified Crossiella TaxID=2620835 RepID=UPI001FFF5E53|nr:MULTISPECIES: hypothetical protein [unclassified Crossiella]MCK2239396.1 hypothetical protein [Crossiella sp. S99.2]MCK2252091.1 hypothetical protein [Crossiella sp. S99.1]
MISPRELPDAYGNPVPRLDYGPGAARRPLRGLLQPRESTDTAEVGRHAIGSISWLFTYDPVYPRERIVHKGRSYDVQGEPERWKPRHGHIHYETDLRHVEG